MSNFYFFKACKTRKKNVLKLMHFACVLRHFPETSLKKKLAENVVFLSNFLFGKCVKNIFKNRLEMNAFCMRFETLCGNKFEKKRAKNGEFLSNFQFGKCVEKRRAKTVLKFMHLACVLRHFLLTAFK